MEPSSFHAGRDRALWHMVGGSLGERYSPRARWWWDNRGRGPAGLVVFQVMLEGRCILRDRDGDHEVLPGQAFLFAYDEPTAYGRPPDRPDWSGWGEPLNTAYLTLGGAGLREHWEVLRSSIGPVVTLGQRSRCLALMAKMQDNFSARSARRDACPVVHAFVMSLFDEIDAAAAHGLGPVERALDDVLRAPLSGHSLKAVAQRHGCTREHLTRVFAQRVGMSPGRWLRQARLQRALELLRATELPMATVATQAGLASARTLARLVRRATGGTLGEARTQSRRR